MIEQKIENVWVKLNENNIVSNLVVADEEFISKQEDSGSYLPIPDYASNNVNIGDTYDGENFLSPKPFDSWLLVNNAWVPPTPHPQTPEVHVWDEETLSWTIINTTPLG
jgi:hypothetical protein